VKVIHTVISGECPPEPDYVERIGMTGGCVGWDGCLVIEGVLEGRRAIIPNLSDALGRFCNVAGEKDHRLCDPCSHHIDPSTHPQIRHGVTVSPLG
jgi:hypothetical protein